MLIPPSWKIHQTWSSQFGSLIMREYLWVGYFLFVLTKISSKITIFHFCWYPCFLVILYGFIQCSSTYFIDWWCWKLEYIIQFICVELYIIIIPGPDNCANPLWKNLLSTYSCHSTGYDGIYLVGEDVFLWPYRCICIVINYDCWPIRVKSNMFWGFHSWG